jgi:hypothetical protein
MTKIVEVFSIMFLELEIEQLCLIFWKCIPTLCLSNEGDNDLNASF